MKTDLLDYLQTCWLIVKASIWKVMGEQ